MLALLVLLVPSVCRLSQSKTLISGGKKEPTRPCVDVVFVLDATGSMNDEIEDVKTSLITIGNSLAIRKPQPHVRFGAVFYRDMGDEEITRVVSLSSDLSMVRKAIKDVRAEGGGDYPEHVGIGLHMALEMDWSVSAHGGVRLIYLVGDAPPKKYDDGYDVDSALALAHGLGIKINVIACSGMMDETAMRSIAEASGGTFSHHVRQQEEQHTLARGSSHSTFVGSTISRSGTSRSVLDFAHLGASLSVRSFARLGSRLSHYGLSRLGSTLSVLDFCYLGASLSVRSFARLGSSLSVRGSSLSLEGFGRPKSSLPASRQDPFGMSKSSFGSLSPALDSAQKLSSRTWLPSGCTSAELGVLADSTHRRSLTMKNITAFNDECPEECGTFVEGILQFFEKQRLYNQARDRCERNALSLDADDDNDERSLGPVSRMMLNGIVQELQFSTHRS